MGHQAAGLTLVAAALCLACAEALVITGDSPGVMRIVAGMPEQPGSSLGESATESMLDEPGGLAVDAEGTLFIADAANARVLRVTAAGQIKAVIDHSTRYSEPRLRAPAGLDLDGAGGLIIADPAGRRVWRLDLESGQAHPIAGTGGAPSTDTTLALQTDLLEPTGVAATPNGSIYVSERTGQRIRRVDPGGAIATIAGDGSAGDGGDGGAASEARLNGPTGLELAGGILYLADSGNHRVRSIDLTSGTIVSIAGTGSPGFAGDAGPALDALLNGPVAVTADLHGLYIADADNHRVRRVSLDSGTIVTFAGNGSDSFSGDLLSAGAMTLKAPQGLVLSPGGLLFVADTGHHIVYRTALGALLP